MAALCGISWIPYINAFRVSSIMSEAQIKRKTEVRRVLKYSTLP